MGKRVRHRLATGVALQRVVADLPGRVHRLFKVTGFDGPELLLHMPRPDAGKTVRLQLDHHRNRVAVGLRHLGARGIGLRQNAQLVLHMMADLMRHDISHGKVAALSLIHI